MYTVLKGAIVAVGLVGAGFAVASMAIAAPNSMGAAPASTPIPGPGGPPVIGPEPVTPQVQPVNGATPSKAKKGTPAPQSTPIPGPGGPPVIGPEPVVPPA